MLKVAVYTIALNEEKFVERWVNSVRDADYLVVGDTGSTDQTIQLLKDRNVQVHDIRVKPWRFDDARNAVLALIPADTDVCLSMDMDELMAPGWREALEKAWIPGSTRLNYTYVSAFDQADNPLLTYNGNKCHARWGYRWQRPVHETVYASGDEQYVWAPDCVMWHKQDHGKSRSQYLPLLEMSHRENPHCSQTLFWLAREYAYQNQRDPAIEYFKKYLDMPEATWHEERCEAQRWLAKLLPHDKFHWLRHAVITAPMKREPWIDLAEEYYRNSDWLNCLAMCAETLKITKKPGSYLDDPNAWGAKPYDLAGIASWNLGLREQSLGYFEEAVKLAPDDARIQNNLKLIRESLGQ
jgi:glycosyltransferase involved in cell wall biosynthesis